MLGDFFSLRHMKQLTKKQNKTIRTIRILMLLRNLKMKRAWVSTAAYIASHLKPEIPNSGNFVFIVKQGRGAGFFRILSALEIAACVLLCLPVKPRFFKYISGGAKKWHP